MSTLTALFTIFMIVGVNGQNFQSQMRPIQCFSCLSGTLSDQSRAMFDRNQQGQGPQQVYDICDDPFQAGNQLLQPCQTSCVKSVTDNSFTRVVLRGCLSDVAQQLTGRNPGLVIPSPGSCTENTINTQNGRITTRTCVCDGHGCNGSSAIEFSFFVLILAFLSYLAI